MNKSIKKSGLRILSVLFAVLITFNSVVIGTVALGNNKFTVSVSEKGTLKGATVSLTEILEEGNEKESAFFSGETAFNGEYSFEISDDGISVGDYHLEVTMVGYKDFEKDVTIADEDKTESVTLTKLNQIDVSGSVKFGSKSITDGTVVLTGYGIEEPVEAKLSSTGFKFKDLYEGKEYSVSFTNEQYTGKLDFKAGENSQNTLDVEKRYYNVVASCLTGGKIEITGLEDEENSKSKYGDKDIKIKIDADEGFMIDSVELSHDGEEFTALEFETTDYVGEDVADVVVSKTLALNKKIADGFDFSDGLTSNLYVKVTFVARSYMVYIEYNTDNGGIYNAYDAEGKEISISNNSVKVENGLVKFYSDGKDIGYKIIADKSNGFHISSIWFDTIKRSAFKLDKNTGELLDANIENKKLLEEDNDNKPIVYNNDFVEYTVKLSNKHYYLIVEFDRNDFYVDLDTDAAKDGETEMGSIYFAETEGLAEDNLNQEMVKYGSNSREIRISANEGYNIDGVQFECIYAENDERNFVLKYGPENGITLVSEPKKLSEEDLKTFKENLKKYIIINEFENYPGYYSFEFNNITFDVKAIPLFSKIKVEDVKTWAEVFAVSESGLIQKISQNDQPDVYIYHSGANVNITSKDKTYKRFMIPGVLFPIFIEKKSISDSYTLISEKLFNLFYSGLQFDCTKGLLIVVDNTAPEIKFAGTDGKTETDWFNNENTINLEIEATDPNCYDTDVSSGVDYVAFRVGKSLKGKVENKDGEIYINEDGKYIFNTKDLSEGEHKVYFAAYDKAGNISKEIEYTFKIDNTHPKITEIYFENSPDENGDIKVSKYGLLPYGSMYKESMKVIIKFSDESETSGAKPSNVGKVIVYLGTDDESGIYENVSVEIDDSNQSATINIPADDSKIYNKEIFFKVVDKAGNESEIKQPLDCEIVNKDGKTEKGTNALSNIIFVDNTEPEVKVEAKNERNDYKFKVEGSNVIWYNGDGVNVEVTVKGDELIGLESVKAVFNEIECESKIYPVNEPKENDSFDYNSTAVLGDEFEGDVEFKVIAKTNTQVEKTVSYPFKIDRTPPTIKSLDVKESTNTILRILTFGIYSNDRVTLRIEADDPNGSGIREMYLYPYKDGSPDVEKGILGELKTDNGLTFYEFSIPKSDVEIKDGEVLFANDCAVVATDNVGNKTDYVMINSIELKDTKDKKLDSSFVMVETQKPDVKVELINDTLAVNYQEGNGKLWTNKQREFKVTVSDDYNDGNLFSGVHDVTAKIGNDVKFDFSDLRLNKDGEETILDKFVNTTGRTDIYYLSGENKESTQYSVNRIFTDGNDEQTAYAEAHDNSGNYDFDRMTIYIDNVVPSITKFDFQPEKYVEGDENPNKTSDGRPVVELENYGYYFNQNTEVRIYAEDKAPSSGLNKILFYTVDVNGEKSNEQSLPIVQNSYASVTIPAGFKGQIFAKPVDNVDNAPEAFETPDGTIVESTEQHNSEGEHIVISRPETKFTDADNKPLYSGKEVPVTLTVKDEYAGIRSVSWSISSTYDSGNNQSGTLNIDNEADFSGDSGWSKNNTELNIATNISKNIKVSNNSNGIVVKVKMEDRAGNITETEDVFSLDSTLPTVEISYNNIKPDKKYDSFYKEVRVAEIKVTERNFDPTLVIPLITNTDGVIPVVSSWEEHPDNENPDLSYYITKLEYNADGDYTFDINMTDRAGNASGDYTPDKFTIDKTMPTIEIYYDNNSVQNGVFYKNGRTAQIIINEHNFDPSRVVITGKAAYRGSETEFPVSTSWADNGDIHTATIHFLNDGDYSYNITFADKAGNRSKMYNTEEFTIDKTAPNLDITGVTELSANSGDVKPVVKFSDTNYNPETVSVTLRGSNKGVVDYPFEISVNEYGETLVYYNFEKAKEVDDVYYLEVAVADYAGNITRQVRKFSVNRFGSTYEIGDAAHPNIVGKYLQNEDYVVIKEINVDNLSQDKIKVKMYKNSVPYDLKAGKDYTLNLTAPGNTEWSQYTYTLNKKLFADDGIYRITVYSVDGAGNVNENNAESKKSDVSFVIDKTNPIIVPVDFESKETYKLDKKIVDVEIKDNIKLNSKSVKVYVDSKEIPVKTKTGDEDLFVFTIDQDTDKHSARIMALDMAGNKSMVDVEDYLVSTNKFSLWYNNTKLFLSTVIGGVFLLAGLIFLIIVLINKKREKEEY